MKYKKLDNNNWIVYIQENGKDKEIKLQFPADSIDQMGYFEDGSLFCDKEVD